MTDTSPVLPPERAWDRRGFLAWLIALTTIPALIWSAVRRFGRPAVEPKTPTSAVGPRFRRRKPAANVSTKLPTGAYLNGRSKIAHYVEKNGVIRGVRRLAASNLQPIDAATLHPLNAGDAVAPSSRGQLTMSDGLKGPRMNLSHSSAAFEILAQEKIRAKSFGGAAELLLCGIEHDLLGVGYRGAKPSFRLYDLLAVLAVRTNNERYLRIVSRMLDSQSEPVRKKFSSRLAAWNNPTGAWRKRWRDPKRMWSGLPM